MVDFLSTLSFGCYLTFNILKSQSMFLKACTRLKTWVFVQTFSCWKMLDSFYMVQKHSNQIRCKFLRIVAFRSGTRQINALWIRLELKLSECVWYQTANKNFFSSWIGLNCCSHSNYVVVCGQFTDSYLNKF